MTGSRFVLSIVPVVLLIIGAVVCGLALLAPGIGLGEREQFFFYQHFSWGRRQLFESGTTLISAGIALLIASYFIKLWPRHSGRVRALIGLDGSPGLFKLPALLPSAWMQSIDVVRSLGLRSSLAIVLWSIFAGVLGFEIYHRFELVGRLQERIEEAFLWIHSNSLPNDPKLNDFLQSFNKVPEGGQFRASSKFDLSIAHETKGTRNFTVATNSHGLLSDHEYTVKRDPENPEYRIAVLGDSFTGPTTSTYQWVDTIEELLNSSRAMRAAVGGKTFRVYNFGWIAAGFQTFWKEYDKAARQFTSDLVIVNYIEWDYPRTDGVHLSTDREMVRHARKYMEKIFEAHDNVIVTLMPNYNDMIPDQGDAMSDYKRTRMLMAEYSRFRPVLMKELMPTILGKEEIMSWFNLPNDAHYSDRGGEIYARKLSSLIAERVTGKRLDFSDVETRYSNIVMGPGKPGLRPVKTSVSYLADSPERIRYLKNYVEREMIKGRIFTFYPYIWNAITGRGTDGIESSSTEPIAWRLIDLPYGPGKDEYVKLVLACLRNVDPDTTYSKWPLDNSDMTLDNPVCKHYFHIYMRGR